MELRSRRSTCRRPMANKVISRPSTEPFALNNDLFWKVENWGAGEDRCATSCFDTAGAPASNILRAATWQRHAPHRTPICRPT
jgi:hypothetical protein